MVSSSSFIPEFKAEPADTPATPNFLAGAASPLWLMFGGAAAAGAAWWWWSNRWREAVNLEAMMALAPEPVAPAEIPPAPPVETVVEEAVAVAETVADVAVETTEQVLEAAVAVTEEAAEVVVETVEAAPEALEPEPVVEAVAETVEPVAETLAEAAAAPVEAAAEVVEAVAEVAEPVIDDLTKLVGVGPKLAASLGELGVTSFAQIAAWTPDELQSFDQLLNLKGRADRDAWVAQAKRFAGV